MLWFTEYYTNCIDIPIPKFLLFDIAQNKTILIFKNIFL